MAIVTILIGNLNTDKDFKNIDPLSQCSETILLADRLWLKWQHPAINIEITVIHVEQSTAVEKRWSVPKIIYEL